VIHRRDTLLSLREVAAAEEGELHRRRLWALLAQATKTPARRFVRSPVTGNLIELRPGERWDPVPPHDPELDELRPVVLGPEQSR
jgi:hypothetical protein